ncbi:uncharacterized protein LOC112185857 isoform X2 [Rosa chinensis]|uniref:uncharacterized protein LOC112185857 isoform X2 n=1 Tax=Rosa chinensis TaxID=74649 RepID=UPI000D094790|nr:uncharacterized protein LOC112185857 isoform X2 [Rosa chinensis]
MDSAGNIRTSGLNTAGACGEDVNCPIQRWCHLCGQVQQVVKGPRSEECPPFDGKHPPKEGPDESPRCPLCEGNMTVMQHWVPEIKRLRPYWRCAGTNGFPYCRGYRWVDEMTVGCTEHNAGDIDARTNLTMYGPNCEVCDGFMMSFISRSELNPGRPYWFCYGYPGPIHRPQFIWGDECKIHFAGFDSFTQYEVPARSPQEGA